MSLISASAQAAGSCKITESPDQNSLEIQYVNQNIKVFGWQHSQMDEHNDNADKVMKLGQMLKEKMPCGFIKPLLLQGVSGKSELLKSSQSIYEKLKSIPVSKTAVLAIEHSKESQEAENQDYRSFLKLDNIPHIWEAFERLKKHCPMLKAEADQFRLVALTPEKIFWVERAVANRSIAIRPVDDEQLRKSSMKTFTNEARLFKQNNPAYSPQVLKEISEINMTMIRDLRGPTDSEIASVTKKVPDLSLRKVTQDGLKHLQNLAVNGRLRDVKMTENLIQLKTDVIYVVGGSHLRGIKKEFEKRCQSGTTSLAGQSRSSQTGAAQ